jgi:NAD(P)-dependent dehydrogenase (short-subunit alcohol dehydrogenase family)
MTDAQDRLGGRTVIVTGASSGIGAETTKALLERGANVVAVARSVGALESLEQADQDGLVVERADVRDREQVEAVVDRAVTRFGGLDAIICNAGIGEYAGFLDMTPETVVEIVETNLLGTVWPIRAALPHMLSAGRGDVIVVSSVAAVMDSAGEAVYAATKAGQRSLAGCLDLEVKERGVRVSTILPGGVRTQFAMGRGRTPDSPDLAIMLDPAEVAAAILTLLAQPPHMRTTVWGFSHLAED